MPDDDDDEKDGGMRESPKGSFTTANTQKNIESILRLGRTAIHSRSTAERMADAVTSVAGSTPFVIVHVFWFGGWVLVNVGLIPGVVPWDPFLFSFLTLVVALEAIFLSLLVLMSQTRMARDADMRAHLDLQINMLAEQEGTVILKMVQRICTHLGLEDEPTDKTQQLEEKTDVNQMAKTLEEKIATDN